MDGRPPKGELSFGANAVLNVSSWFVPALTALVAVPITVRGLGDDAYGLLTLISAVVGYLGLMELGLGTAIVRYLSHYRALNEGRPMIGIIRFATTWFGIAGVLGGGGLAVGAPWIATSVLKVPPELTDAAVTSLYITAFGFVAGIVVSVGAVIPQSFLRYDISALTTVVFGVLGSAGPAVLVSLGFGLVPVVSYGVAVNVVVGLLYVLIGWRLFMGIDLHAGPEWRSFRREALRFAGITALNQVHSVITSQTSRVVVGAALSISAAAYYQVPSMLASRLGSMLTRLAQVVFPTASSLRARGDHEAVTNLYLRASRIIFLVNASGNMALAALAFPLLAHYVNPGYAHEGWAALMIFAISSVINASTMCASYVNLAASRPGINLLFAFANSAIALALVYPLTVRFGVAGASLAGLIGDINVPFFFWYSHTRIIHVRSWHVWRTCYQPTVLANIIIGALTYWLLARHLPNLFLTLLAFVGVGTAGVLLSGVFGAVKRTDIDDLATMIRHLSRRRPPTNPEPPTAGT